MQGACCKHNEKFIRENNLPQTGGAIPLILAFAGSMASSFLIKLAVQAIINSLVTFGRVLMASTDMTKEEKKRMYQRYLRYLISKENLLVGPLKSVAFQAILRQAPLIESSIRTGVNNAADFGVNNAADFASLVANPVP